METVQYGHAPHPTGRHGPMATMDAQMEYAHQFNQEMMRRGNDGALISALAPLGMGGWG